MISKVFLAVLAAVAIVGCESGSASDEGLDKFVESVRANGFAVTYDDDAVKNMGKNICSTLDATDGNDARAEGVLDNYSGLAPEEREEMVDIARGTACE